MLNLKFVTIVTSYLSFLYRAVFRSQQASANMPECSACDSVIEYHQGPNLQRFLRLIESTAEWSKLVI